MIKSDDHGLLPLTCLGVCRALTWKWGGGGGGGGGGRWRRRRRRSRRGLGLLTCEEARGDLQMPKALGLRVKWRRGEVIYT
jgi:hypothetical protein